MHFPAANSISHAKRITFLFYRPLRYFPNMGMVRYSVIYALLWEIGVKIPIVLGIHLALLIASGLPDRREFLRNPDSRSI